MIFLMIFSMKILIFSENLDFLYENLWFVLSKILMISSIIFGMIHKIFFYKIRVSVPTKIFPKKLIVFLFPQQMFSQQIFFPT